jgi:hypothetical protein
MVKTKNCKSSKKCPKTRKIRGGFLDTLFKYTLGEKRSELLPQAQTLFKGFLQGYGIGGIGGWTDFAWENGGRSYLLTVPLSSIILWHPVRGRGERAQAGPKTTSRADSMYNVLMNSLSLVKKRDVPIVTYTKKKPLTFAQIDTVPGMKSDDTIKICPINIVDGADDATRTEIDELSKKISHLKKYGNTTGIDALITRLQTLLYKDTNYKQHFLVLSGQGRLQAIIEAVRNANIPPDEFFIRLECRNVYLDICNVLIKIHNYWVSEGDFDDPRHEVYMNGDYLPMDQLRLAFSCSEYRNRLDTLCYAEYKNDSNPSQNMPCQSLYNYKKPLARVGTK